MKIEKKRIELGGAVVSIGSVCHDPECGSCGETVVVIKPPKSRGRGWLRVLCEKLQNDQFILYPPQMGEPGGFIAGFLTLSRRLGAVVIRQQWGYDV